MQRTTIAGHAFSLFYEDGSTPAAPSLRISGRDYRPRAAAANEAPAADPARLADLPQVRPACRV